MRYVDPINAKIEGEKINTSLLYAAYITLFDNSKYTNKSDVMSRLITCFYTVTMEKVETTDSKGKKTVTQKEVTKAVTDTTQILNSIEKAFNLTISKSEQLYMISLAEVLGASDSASLAKGVLTYEPLVSKYCTQYGIPEYTTLVLAVMQQESGGTGTDPMQCSESPYNTKYSQKPNSITDPEYSIDIGVQYLASCLKAAKCKSPDDIPGISLALQGYNFGNGYIAWALQKGGYSSTNAVEFSQEKATQLNWTGYGDVNYVSHVLRYYNQSTDAVSNGSDFYPPIQTGKYTITSPFGNRSDPTTGQTKFHEGVDFAAAFGTPICASDKGTVIYSQFGSAPYGGYGNIVIVRHSSNLITMYGHCSKLLVSVGQTITKGEKIAEVGRTGDSTGNHCHFEVRVNDKSVDPMPYLKSK